MALYKVPVKWEQCGYLIVHAENQIDAASVAMNDIDAYPLDSQTVSGSLSLALPQGSETEYIARIVPGFEER